MNKGKILVARKHLGLSQVQFASRLGITERMVRYYEYGHTIPERTKIQMRALIREYELDKAIAKAGLKII